jgi:hypothetical protein
LEALARHGEEVFIGTPLLHERVSLERVQDDFGLVRFSFLELALRDARSRKHRPLDWLLT